MILPGGLGALTWCLNIHPTQSWQEARAALTGPARAVKAALSPDEPFVVGLRFSAETVAELAEPGKRAELKTIFAAEGFLPLTMNGFPYGPFHGARVKEEVYLPDWRAKERLAYTCALADLMAEINPEGAFLSLSTVPGAFRPNGAGAEAAMADMMLRAAAHLVKLEAETGRRVALALEPEPCCFLETIEESAAFFRAHLFSDAAAARLAALTGRSKAQAADLLPRHLGLCYDVCHAAVEFEDAAQSLAILRESCVPVHKLQLSSALRIPSGSPEARAALAAFDDGVYLHQLIAKGPVGLRRFADLPLALAPGGAEDGEEWRVHFHVPVFLETLPAFGTTQGFLAEILALHRAEPISEHLEVETYTWSVLPPGLAAGSVDQAVARELNWVKARLA
ncbi:MAG: metabolite traffic protein EboE [Pikeienuella sp.]|uniref:metabolite traffic protein EboE n=1 Tax=Pikeienuella sp. TaxID=2831957 RepID=UPI00391C2043